MTPLLACSRGVPEYNDVNHRLKVSMNVLLQSGEKLPQEGPPISSHAPRYSCGNFQMPLMSTVRRYRLHAVAQNV